MLRSATASDLGFLHDLYASTRDDELSALPWPDDARARFLDQQFDAQHRHFLSVFADADFLVVTARGRPVGRLYLDRSRTLWRIVDIALLPALRGAGVGSALIRWMQAAASAARADGIDLHVLSTNPGAARLYAVMGFVAVHELVAATHWRMVWRVS